jgi:hypothetical protein
VYRVDIQGILIAVLVLNALAVNECHHATSWDDPYGFGQPGRGGDLVLDTSSAAGFPP